jgi:hypothetical protein
MKIPRKLFYFAADFVCAYHKQFLYMSSHHFVKEDQEPALVIADSAALPFTLTAELLEWSPTVIVLEKAVEDVLSWGIKVDVVIALEQHVKDMLEVLRDQAPIKVIAHQPDEKPCNTAMYFLRAGQYRAVNVIGVNPAEANDFAAQLDIVAFYDTRRWVYARQGKFEKWLTQGTRISFSEKPRMHTGIDEDGVVIQDGLVQASSDHAFWVGEYTH